jgi:hypothetical protein
MKGPKISIALGTAAFGGQVTQLYGESVLKLQEACLDRGIEFHYMVQSGDALVQRARQQLTARFLEMPSATHLLMVDADIGFEPEQVFRLLEFDQDFTAAAYPRKKRDVLSYEVEPLEPRQERDGFFRASFVGVGFLLLKRQALLRMMEAYPELRYSAGFIAADPLAQSSNRSALFNCWLDPATKTYLAEDVSFCRRWTQIDGEIWVDAKSRLSHVGSHVFQGNLGK